MTKNQLDSKEMLRRNTAYLDALQKTSGIVERGPQSDPISEHQSVFDEWQHHLDEAKATAVRQSRLIAQMKELLENCENYFDERADAEYESGVAAPIGNEEASMLVEIRTVLETVKE